MARGKQIGDDRFLAGMHYPSDVAGGQILGAEIAKMLLANPAFLAKLDQAKAECLAEAPAKH
jgi:membrane-associated phospholipid phosphatase